VMIQNLERGFSSAYMDPEGMVAKTVSELQRDMDLYVANKDNWIAPYTSLVTSSMMGKSRHMKEVANHLPSVYICLRGEVRGYGYPRPSPIIVDWSSQGVSTILNKRVEAVDDRNFYLSTLRWSAFILSTIKKLAIWIDDGRFFTSLGIDDSKAKLEFPLLWKFFAEPPNARELKEFWLEVVNATHSLLSKYRDGNSAHAYFKDLHAKDVQEALTRLRSSRMQGMIMWMRRVKGT
jgi:hypothetical protein